MYETENPANKSHSVLVQRKNFDDLKKDKKLIKSIEKFTLRSSNSFQKQYYDSVNNFYIDLDNVMFTQDSLNNQAYTFKINRTPNNGLFENLILKTSTDGDFDAILAQYNQNALNLVVNNSDVATLNTIMQNVNFVYLGKSNLTDINSRLQVNNTCYEPGFAWAEGSKCASGQHAFGQGCDYLGTSDAATSGGYVYTLVPVPCESGGGGNNDPQPGDGGFTTGPHQTGGGNNQVQTPCETLNDAMQNTKVNQGIQNLKTKTITKKESAYEITRKFNLTDENYIYDTILKAGDDHSTVVKTGGFIKGQAHNHTRSGQSIPSIGDINWLKQCQDSIYPESSIGYNIIVCPNPTSPTDPNTAIIYAITVDNLTTLTNQMNNIFGTNFDSLTIEEKSKNHKDLNDKYAEKFADVQNSSAGMEQKFLELHVSFGISLHKFDNNTNKWNKLNLINNTVLPQPCE